MRRRFFTQDYTNWSYRNEIIELKNGVSFKVPPLCYIIDAFLVGGGGGGR